MNSSFEQGENVTSSLNGDDKRNPNAKGQMTNKAQMSKPKWQTNSKIQMINKVQMSKFKGHTAGPGAGGTLRD